MAEVVHGQTKWMVTVIKNVTPNVATSGTRSYSHHIIPTAYYKRRRPKKSMSSREEELRENPYFVRAGSELGAMDGMFSMPKLSVPKLSVPKLSVPKLSVPKFSVPKLSVPKMFSKSAPKAPAPAAPAPAKAPAKEPVPEFSDLSGKPLSSTDKSHGPKMFYKKGFTVPAPGDLVAEAREITTTPDLMYYRVQKKFCLTSDYKKALACDWLHNKKSVYSCLVLKNNILMLCFIDGDLNEAKMFWKPFAIKNYITKDSIRQAITVAKNWPKVIWFTKQED